MAGTGLGATQTDAGGSASFTVFLRGARVGSQNVEVTHTSGRLHITAVGRLDPPLDLLTTKFDVVYAADGTPETLSVEGRLRGETFTLTTAFANGQATSRVSQGTETGTRSAAVSPGAIVLPNSFFGAYEALALRLAGAGVGARLPVFAAPDAEATAVVDSVTPRRILTPEGTVEVRDYLLTLAGATGPVPLEIWVDGRGRMARVVLPAAALAVVRDDLASVMTRVEPVKNPGDESFFIPANGFSLAATVTRPAASAGKVPAAVLVASPGPQGREHLSYGVPIFGQLAGHLAAAGVLVVRYDARGVGQTGGRIESAGIPEYGEDALAAVTWLRKRPDVDPNRIILVGYGDGGPVALAAAARDKNVKGLALIASPGMNGRDVTLEQQALALQDLPMSDQSKGEKIALQTQVIDAVLTGRGWTSLPAELRREFDSTWFRTWLVFSPAEMMKKAGQPLIIVHGAADHEVPPAHADRLEQLALARRGGPNQVKKVVLPGVNHLLVPAATGRVDEYGTLSSRTVTPAVAEALTVWLVEVGRTR